MQSEGRPEDIKINSEFFTHTAGPVWIPPGLARLWSDISHYVSLKSWFGISQHVAVTHVGITRDTSRFLGGTQDRLYGHGAPRMDLWK